MSKGDKGSDFGDTENDAWMAETSFGSEIITNQLTDEELAAASLKTAALPNVTRKDNIAKILSFLPQRDEGADAVSPGPKDRFKNAILIPDQETSTDPQADDYLNAENVKGLAQNSHLARIMFKKYQSDENETPYTLFTDSQKQLERDEEAAAVKIQAGFRGMKGRQVAKEIKEIEEESSSLSEAEIAKRDAAVIKIQAAFRGNRVRKNLKEEAEEEARNKAKEGQEELDRQTAAAIEIQALWRGFSQRKRGIVIPAAPPTVTPEASRRSKKRKKRRYDYKRVEDERGGELATPLTIMNRVDRQNEYNEIGKFDESNPILQHVHGDIKNNKRPGNCPHDYVMKDGLGLMTVNYDETRLYSYFEYLRSVEGAATELLSQDNSETRPSFFQPVIFEGHHLTTRDSRQRPNELIYNRNGLMLRHIGFDKTPDSLGGKVEAKVKEKAKLSGDETKRILNQNILGNISDPNNPEYEDAKKHIFELLGIVHTKERPAKAQDCRKKYEEAIKDPAIAEKINLEIKALGRFRKTIEASQHDPKSTPIDLSKLSDEDRYAKLKALDGEYNRGIQQQSFEELQRSLEAKLMTNDNKNALRSIALEIRSNSSGENTNRLFQNTDKLPIPAGNGVVISERKYYGTPSKACSISVVFNNDSENGGGSDQSNDEKNTQYIAINSDSDEPLYIRVRKIPAGMGGVHTYKNGERQKALASEDRERILIDEDTVFRAVQGENGNITYKQYGLNKNRTHSRAENISAIVLKSNLKSFKDDYKNITIEAISFNEGEVTAMGAKVADQSKTIEASNKSIVRAKITSLEAKILRIDGTKRGGNHQLSDAAKNELRGLLGKRDKVLDHAHRSNEKTSNRLTYDSDKKATSIDQIAGDVFRSKFLSHKLNSNKVRGVSKLAKLSSELNYENLEQRPDVREFSRRVARYAVKEANKHHYTKKSRIGFLGDIFQQVDNHLVEAAKEYSNDQRLSNLSEGARNKFKDNLQVDMKSYAQVMYSQSSKRLSGYGKISGETTVKGRIDIAAQNIQRRDDSAKNEIKSLDQRILNSLSPGEPLTPLTKSLLAQRETVLDSSYKDGEIVETDLLDFGSSPNLNVPAYLVISIIRDNIFRNDGKNGTLIKLSTELYCPLEKRPDVREFSRQIAKFAVDKCDHHSLKEEDRKNLFEEVSQQAAGLLLGKSGEFTPRSGDVDNFTEDLKKDIEIYTKAKSLAAANMPEGQNPETGDGLRGRDSKVSDNRNDKVMGNPSAGLPPREPGTSPAPDFARSSQVTREQDEGISL